MNSTETTAERWLRLARAQAARFVGKIEPRGDCWIWTAGKDKDGYGRHAITAPLGEKPKQKHVRAHRLAWEMINGPAEPDLVTMHSCDTPACVAPWHLTLGTQTQNRADCTAKDRNAKGLKNGKHTHPESRPRGDDHPRRRHPELVTRGEAHPNAKRTEADVRRIRDMHASGLSCAQIGRLLGLPKGSVIAIAGRRTWRHVA